MARGRRVGARRRSRVETRLSLGICCTLASLAVGCTPYAKLSVAPAVIDRAHRPQAWYVRVVRETRAKTYGDHVVFDGIVCDNKPAIIKFKVSCPQEFELSGEIWRLPDRSWCGKPPPVFSVDAMIPGARCVARLQPITLFRGWRGECSNARSIAVALWPPVDWSKAGRAAWRRGEFWLAPEETPYVLETNPPRSVHRGESASAGFRSRVVPRRTDTPASPSEVDSRLATHETGRLVQRFR